VGPQKAYLNMPLLPKTKSNSNQPEPNFSFHVEFDTTIYPDRIGNITHGFSEYEAQFRRNLRACRREEEAARTTNSYYSSEEAITSCCRIVADILSSAFSEKEEVTVKYQAEDTSKSGSARRNWTTTNYYKRKLVERGSCKY
jgi:hypothetical protein